ncbi:GPI-anchored cell wall organization protein ecm33 [Phlyctema vagabunda]|uniref:GPI-anchored cell wall organization protein ecm33 n=1 Tax=Phlyctema vagabunda TaxID=108571 RepID=A0ABR4PM96_9HELO
MFSQSLVLAAVAVGGVYAQSTASACSAATVTVNSAADATAIADCSTIKGDLLVGPNAVGVIDLSGPEAISGSLIVENAGLLVTLQSNTIGTIGDSFTLTNLTTLSTLSFGSLVGVGQIAWSALPALPQLTFPASVSKAKSVLITNTFLSTLDGINLDSVDTMDINNNNRLRTFSTQVSNITQMLNIDSNGRNLEVTFPNLEWAANMTFRNISSISFPSLAVINGSLGFYENYFESINAPNLTSITSGSLAIVANPSLANLSMPLLEAIGGGNLIANNSALDAISFPVLANVGGAIDFSGNFTTPELPALEDVKGGFNMQSTTSISCDGFQKEKDNGAIQGKYTCKTTEDATSDPDGTATGTSTGSSSSSSSTSSSNAAVQVGFNAQSAIGLSVVGGFLGMLL